MAFHPGVGALVYGGRFKATHLDVCSLGTEDMLFGFEDGDGDFVLLCEQP